MNKYSIQTSWLGNILRCIGARQSKRAERSIRQYLKRKQSKCYSVLGFERDVRIAKRFYYSKYTIRMVIEQIMRTRIYKFFVSIVMPNIIHICRIKILRNGLNNTLFMHKRAPSQKRIEDCKRKTRFTKREAQQSRNYEKEHHGNILYCYQCVVCNYWHLTSKRSEIK